MYKIGSSVHLVCRLTRNAFIYILYLIPNSKLKRGRPQRPCLVLILSKVIISHEQVSFSVRVCLHAHDVIDSWVFLGELNIQLTEFSLKKERERDREIPRGRDTSIINIYISFYILLSEASESGSAWVT